MIQLKRINSSNYNDMVEPGQIVLEYNSTPSLPPRVKVGKLQESDSFHNLPYLIPDTSKYRDEGLYFPQQLNLSCQQLNITAGTAANLNGSPIVTATSVLNTGLKLIGVGTIRKQGTPYFEDPPAGTYIQTDYTTTFNDAAFMYDRGENRYSQLHFYTSFVGHDHLVWDTTKHLYKFDSGSLNYHVTLVKITVFLSGSLIQDPNKESAGIWYTPYGFSDSERPK